MVVESVPSWDVVKDSAEASLNSFINPATNIYCCSFGMLSLIGVVFFFFFFFFFFVSKGAYYLSTLKHNMFRVRRGVK